MLAGGQSRRMGRDKAAMAWRETTLLGHALDRLAVAGFAPVVVGRESAVGPSIPDSVPGLGPLAGLEAALRSLEDSGQPAALFLPVDVPLLPVEFLRWIWQRARATGAAATVPVLGGMPQPLCAVYAACLAGPMAQALREGRRRVVEALPPFGVDRFACEAVAAAQGWAGIGSWFANVNTPEEWERCADMRSAKASSRIQNCTEAR